MTQQLTTEQTSADDLAIVQTALDYIEGYYTGDGERMERSLHPALAKRIVQRDAGDGRERLDEMSALDLVQRTRRHTPTLPDNERRDVTVLDRFEHSASVRIDATSWVDYLHLARWQGRWVIVNVLWELRPA
jgi:hypothetical protein